MRREFVMSCWQKKITQLRFHKRNKINYGKLGLVDDGD